MHQPSYRTLSKRTVDRLSVDDKDTVFWDRELPGYGVRVYPVSYTHLTLPTKRIV